MNKRAYFGRDLEAMSFAQNYHKWIIDEIHQYLGKNVAEVGAGSGNFSEHLLSLEINRLVAFEPSRNMFISLHQKYNKRDDVVLVNDYFEEYTTIYKNYFDSVCYVNVLEHIKDDSQALAHAYKALKTNGYILIFVPALSFLFSDFDKKVGHYKRYQKKDLVQIVTQVGFSLHKVKYFDVAGILPWYVAFVLLRQDFTETNVSIYDKLIVPIMHKLERIIPPPIGKNLILVGRKP